MRKAGWLAGGIALLLLAAVLVFRWDWLIPMAEARLGVALGRPVSIGQLTVHPGAAFTVTATDVRLGNPAGFPADPPFALLPRVMLRLDGWALLRGRMVMQEVALDRPAMTLLESPEGSTNARMPAGDGAGPTIGLVRVTDGQVRVTLPSLAADLTLRVATTDAGTLAASAAGTYAAQPITGEMTGGAVIGMLGETEPWPVQVSLANGPTRLTLRGSLRDPLALAGADLWLAAAGPSMGLLTPLTGVPIPATPAYAVAGRLEYADGRFRFFDLAGRVGRTDLNGEVIVAPRAARPAAELPLAPARAAAGRSAKTDSAPAPAAEKANAGVSVIGGAAKAPEETPAGPAAEPAARTASGLGPGPGPGLGPGPAAEPPPRRLAEAAPGPAADTTRNEGPGARVEIDPLAGTPRPDATPRGLPSGPAPGSATAAAIAAPPSERRRAEVTANLTSRHVDLADLAGFIGAEPVAGAAVARTGRSLPSTPLNIPRIRSANIHLTYHGERIEGDVPLDDLHVTMDLIDGVITLHPVRFGMGQGQIEAEAVLTPREDGALAAEATIGFQRLDVARMMAAAGLGDGAGTLGGRARIAGAGRSVADLLGRADGEVAFGMAGGHLSALLVDLSGLRLGNALLSALGLPNRTEIGCFVADFSLRQGLLTARNLLLDTSNALVTGTGTVDLSRDALALSLRTEAKRFTVGALPTAIQVGGTFENATVRPEPLELGLRGGIAVALGVVALPLAILPTIQFGIGDDRRCAGLLARRPDTAPAAPPRR